MVQSCSVNVSKIGCFFNQTLESADASDAVDSASIGALSTEQSSEGGCMACPGCPAGQERKGCEGGSVGACVECEAGTYKETEGYDVCLPCAAVSVASAVARGR